MAFTTPSRFTSIVTVSTLVFTPSLTVTWKTSCVLAKPSGAVKFGVVDEAHDRIQVLSGLAEGETVVTGPVEGFVDGQAVRVTGKGE